VKNYSGIRSILRFLYIFNVIFLGLIFFTSGMAKVFAEHKFPGIIGPVWLEEKLIPYGLGLYARFIAFTQLIIGYLLITWHYRKIASVALLPMLINILVVTISLQWRGTPYVLTFFILQLAFILWMDRNAFAHLLWKSNPEAQGIKITKWNHLLMWSGLILILFSIVISDNSLITAWSICAAGLSLGIAGIFITSERA